MNTSPATADAERLYDAVTRLVRVYQSRDRERICCHDITLSQWAALEHLVDRGPMSLTVLAHLLNLDKSSASRAVDGLVRKQWLERVESAQDRRAVVLAASPAGAAFYQRVRADLVQGEVQAIADMAPEVRQAAILILDRLTTTAQRRLRSAEACCPVPARQTAEATA